MANMVILGISANSRVIGLAAIRSTTLLDFSVRLFKESWSDTKAEKIVASLTPCIRHHSITHVALAIPHAYYQNKETEALIALIKTYCRKKKIRVSPYHPEAFHSFSKERKAKKKAMMQTLVDLYPELHLPYKKELQNKRRYYHKLFEAVGAATLLAREVQ